MKYERISNSFFNKATSFYFHSATFRVERYITQRNAAFPATATTANDTLDTRREFRQMERFRQVVVRTFFQPEDLVFQRIPSRDNDYVFAFIRYSKTLEKLQPVAVRQHNVQ